jgi:RNA polymerase sigma-54 factor
MTLGFRHTQKQRQTLTLNQTRVFGLNVLVLSQREVDAAIDALGEQDLLDTVPTAQDDQPDSPTTAEANEDASDESPPEHFADHDHENAATEFTPETSQADQGVASRNSGGDNWTPEDYLTAPPDFRERIRAQLNETRLPDHQQRIVTFIVEALDSRGFFTEDIEESAQACGTTAEDFSSLIALIQQCEPVGVAARNAWDAIRLVLERNARHETLEWRIASCMAELVETGELLEITAGASAGMPKADCECVALELSQAVATRLDIGAGQVRQSLQRLLKVVPHPVDQHEEEVTPWRDHHLQSQGGGALDLAISHSADGGFSVELCGSRYASIAISKTLLVQIDDLKEQLKPLRQAKHLPGEMGAEAKDKIVGLTIKREQKEECKEHVMQFLRACEDRRSTLLRVATVLAHRQKAFLKSGKIFDLQCFSPEDAGAELELGEFGGQALSESTVSRAVQDKFVRLPNGQVKPLKLLCSPGEKATNTDGQEVRYLPEIVKQWIRDYIRREDRAHPLSDEQIAKAIERDEDLVLARKTIENYRKELEFPSARERKRKPTKH